MNFKLSFATPINKKGVNAYFEIISNVSTFIFLLLESTLKVISKVFPNTLKKNCQYLLGVTVSFTQTPISPYLPGHRPERGRLTNKSL